ncbi:unnamed protein product [[Candida] boidinii]|nr:unnamed protein product [[Candida] boidinii]GMG13174.1 unnamed protein product [[Candida] boidinii]
MSAAIAIPDLRFEESFRRALLANAKSYCEAEKLELQKLRLSDDDEIIEPIPIITPGIVIYTVLKDQLFMPFIQGFASALILLKLRPYLAIVQNHGRRVGISIVNGIKSLGNTIFFAPTRGLRRI